MTVLGIHFRHEALFYSGEDEFLAGVLPFIREGVEAGEPMLIAVDEAKIRAIKGSLNGETESVQFADMSKLGKNPACIIPAWRDFVSENLRPGCGIRGIGEPIWPGRSDAELVECHHHESLLNLAFDGTPGFRLVCPYDTKGLDADVLEEAHRTHPLIAETDASRPSDDYTGIPQGLLVDELPPPATVPEELGFSRQDLRAVRAFVSERATSAQLSDERVSDLVLAASELATNSVLHGGGEGTLRVWREESALICEVRDTGHLEEPLVGRERPGVDWQSGRGLWLVNHLCDLVQIRALPGGNVVRLHMALS